MASASDAPPDAGPAKGSGRARARQAILVTCGVYGVYGLWGLTGLVPEVRTLALVAAFYFLPGFVLRRDPKTQARYQVGPDGPIPPVSRRGIRLFLITAAFVFPPFVLAFFWFYDHVCAGQLWPVGPVIWLEGLTPWAGGLEQYLHRLCRNHGGGMWPAGLWLPEAWQTYFGGGALLAVAIELFAIALPEEVFHRGYLMSALEERWPPKRRVFGVPFGVAAIGSSALFAIGHLVGMAQVARLATFFPALLFAWLWRRSNSLWAPALFHAASNLLMAVLIASTFPRP